ncbi:dienelactone hydrolase family protein [Hydrotalea sp.]|uniref:dienelactone hydrolase family protein n=1 Tax=Hydrotalea sp. TaxID=2881279 RepID=UPI002630F4E2|nr:dienelactone hydrolase family protein [Hydrotalea sp.]
MKKLIILAGTALVAAVLLSATFKQKKPEPLTPECYISCFNAETRQLIELDAAKPGFGTLHPNPIILKDFKALGKTIQYTTAGGKIASGYFIKAKNPTKKWVLVFQEWWGLNDNIKNEADKLYTELGDVNVLAPDMYDGKVATTPDSAMVYMRNASADRLDAIVKGAIAYAGKDAKIYTIGWCFGGGWSLQAALLADKQAAGCVMYYGRPENNIERLKGLNCDVIGFFANQDQGINPEVVTRFEENMKAAGKKLAVYRYNAGHGFANPSNPIYNKQATEDAHTKALAFLESH